MKNDLVRFLLSAVILYYAVMIIIYLNREVFFNPGPSEEEIASRNLPR